MALVSPGVEVTVTDESQYLPSPNNSVPFILLATAQNKANPNGTGVAAATTAANAGKLNLVTSQRDLVSLYGSPFFYTDATGTPLQGYELNEYGLLAAYSALGITNRVYCLRADIDLASLVGQTSRPVSNPAAGTYWLDTTSSTWGINEFDQVTGQFVSKSPIIISEVELISGSAPIQTLGIPGDYAVITIPTYDYPTSVAAGQFFYKSPVNEWVRIGTKEWLAAWPTVQGTQYVPSLSVGDELTIQIGGGASITVAVPASPDNTVDSIVTSINALNLEYLTAVAEGTVNKRLVIYSTQTGQDYNSVDPFSITLSGTGTILNDLGIVAGTFYQPSVAYGTSAQQPLWQSQQAYPRPSGSIWMKVGSTGTGLTTVISQWDDASATWVSKNVAYSTSDWAAIAALDSTGGKNIVQGKVYAQYNFDYTANNNYSAGPIYYWERIAEGPTVITGTNTSPSFTNGPYTVVASVSVPGSSALAQNTFTLADNTTAIDFVTAWNNTPIPYTIASLSPTGAIVITHTEGGVINISDLDANGFSSGLLVEAGFVIGSTLGVKEGPFVASSFTPTASSTTGVGIDLAINVTNSYQNYFVDATTFTNAGSGYVVGDEVTFSGTDLGGTSPANDLVVKITAATVPAGVVESISVVSGTGAPVYSTQLSNWVEFNMTANEGAPVNSPANLTNWYYSVVDEIDIMVNTATGWQGYRNVAYDSNGFPLPTGSNITDPNGPIVSSTEPALQSDGTALEYGDLWVDTSDLENYPIINRWQNVNGTDMWTRIDTADSVNPSGMVFADARWATNGTTNPANDPIPTITSLLTSDYLDPDAVDNSLYPVGMLLFNTRRSGNNVKQYRVNYFNNDRFPDTVLPTEKDSWVSASGLQANGVAYMGRKAQRAIVVKAMKSVIDSNTAIRDEDNVFNLIAAPNYPELQPNMITLNNDRGETGFIVGDTPMRLPDDGTAIQAWATNAAGAASTGEDGLVTRNTYLGLFYPSGLTNDLNGNLVAVPSSHMMIRTILRNDNISYPWFAPAGTRRGVIDNASSIGYVDAATGEFQPIKTRIGIRDVLYTNQINPMVYFTGNGLLNYGNKTSFNSSSALDRINVARLIAYIRRQLTVAARPFIFEPNDALTRQEVASVFQTLMVELVAKRGIYDYLVVCDESNNTPARIDRNELWVDIAIEPVKTVEFIYIPVRVLNTGEVQSLV